MPFFNKTGHFITTNIVSISILVVILMQNPFWPFWNVGNIIAFAFLIFLVFYFFKKKRFILSKGMLFPFMFLSFMFVLVPLLRGGLHLSSILYIFSFILASRFQYGECKCSLHLLSLTIAIVIICSLPAWLLSFTGFFEIPSIGDLNLTDMKIPNGDIGSVVMENHIFYVSRQDAGMPRFYSVFDEPGVLGTLGAFLLYGGRYDFSKWYNIVLLLGCIFTFSFAFYTLTFIGFILQRVSSITKMLSVLIPLSIIVVCIYFYLSEDELFSALILNRGINVFESLNNRVDVSVQDYYSRLCLLPFLFGEGANSMKETGILGQGASYKLFIIENGLLGVASLLLIYYSLIYKKIRQTIAFFIIFFISFLQRPNAHIAWQIFVFVIIIREYEYDYIIKKSRFRDCVPFNK